MIKHADPLKKEAIINRILSWNCWIFRIFQEKANLKMSYEINPNVEAVVSIPKMKYITTQLGGLCL